MKHVAKLFLVLALMLPVASCGTLMFEDRPNAPHSGKMDPNVVIMDALCLLLFIVPGVVAFAVDASNGALYLPEGVERGEGPFFD